MKKHNFNAGPSILPQEVIENAAKAVLDFNGSGLSLLSISHRTKDFDAVMDQAIGLFHELLDIPENYKIIFLGGGASTQFFEVPANFLNTKAGYVNTGVWSKKAIKEAKRYGQVEVLATSEDKNFTYIPKGFAIPTDLDYLHITTNNTIYGTEYHEDIDSPVPVIADMSSDILSRPIDVKKYAMIYGGAQKNLAPAGLTIVIIREDLAGQELPITPAIMNYKSMIDKDSMYNTPPCWCIYMLGLMCDWLEQQGGAAGMEKINQKKAQMLYDVLDNAKLFTVSAEKGSRSHMNVTFRSASEEMDAKFVAESVKAGFTNLKGHRSVGGMRASIYNAMPTEGVEKLCDFIQKFDKEN